MAVGAVTNGFESIVRQKLNGQDIDWGTVALDGGIGGLTAGAFHYGGKAVDSASPYVKKAFNKVSSKLSENAKYARLALENVNSKANKSVVLGSNFGNVSKKVDDFVDEFKNVKNSSSSIDDLTNNAYKGVSNPVSYKRPSGFRKGVRDKVWDNAKNANGDVIDPLTKKVMDKSEPWDMGHKPGFEFRKHKKSAEERGIPRKQFLDEHNNPDHYTPELPSSNRGHKGEDLTDNYFGD
nr:HNH/ENDO VII family nuclease [Clostridium butyricum]